MALKHGLAPLLRGRPALRVAERDRDRSAIERRHRTVVLLEGAPTSALDALRAAVWAKPVLY